MDLPDFLTAPLGLMLGMTVLSPVLRWGFSIWTVVTERRRDPAHRSRWRIVAVALLHSGPWFAIAAGTFAWFMLSRPHTPAWDWFFGGALLAPVIFGLSAARMLKRGRVNRLKTGTH
ncbi:MAG TPA: hypothetical protein VGM16_03950 [Gammaproteobacteria bacterium]|jgi:hypothetical protein